MKLHKIGFIGTGNIATAILNGIVSSGYIKPECIMVYDANKEKTDFFSDMGCIVSSCSSDLVKNCEYVFLTVKPQIYPIVLDEIKDFTDGSCFIDVAAGISIDTVKSYLGSSTPVIRVMPNTPLLVGLGSTALVKQAPVTDEQFDFIKGCFDSCGITTLVNEEDINTVIAVSGSSPAYIMRFANAIIKYGVSNGLDADEAKSFVVQTLAGCAKLITQSNKDIDELIANVTSPNGTTACGLKSLDDNSFENIIKQCLDKTVERAKELSK